MSNEINVLNNEELVSVVKHIIRNHTDCKEHGNKFSKELYVTYNECLSKRQVKEIAESANKEDGFLETLEDYVRERSDDSFDDVMEEIEGNWEEKTYGDFEEYEEQIRRYVRENVDFNFPYEHFRKHEVLVNILVDTGDGQREYTLNNFASFNAPKEMEIDDRSSLLWLAKQQGYTKEQLLDATRRDNLHDSTFLKSVRDECHNSPSYINALYFFVRMPIDTYMELSDREEKTPLVLDKTTSCGLFDKLNGGGSLLEIQLEKEVVIPGEFIRLYLEDELRYNIVDVYGMFEKFWKETIIEQEKDAEEAAS